jgi:hypothetical protein
MQQIISCWLLLLEAHLTCPTAAWLTARAVFSYRSPLKRGLSPSSPGRDDKPKPSLRRGDAAENGRATAVSTAD